MLSDWKRGEKFFKDYLLDYDETVNIWNWQWSASVGADPKPIRIFNPCLQSEKFDKNCEYIRKFIPELEWFSNEQIHNPDKFDLKYAKPILDLKKTRVEALEEYKKSKRSIY
jgi:deoxyribodipyrimidine photo-lyase